MEVAGRRTKETRKEKPKGDDRQVERRRKFISKEMWDDAPDVSGSLRERFLGLGLPRAFTPLTLLTHLPYCTRPMATLEYTLCFLPPFTDQTKKGRCARLPMPLQPANTWSRSFTFNRHAIKLSPQPLPVSSNQRDANEIIKLVSVGVRFHRDLRLGIQEELLAQWKRAEGEVGNAMRNAFDMNGPADTVIIVIAALT
ncbi:hypothetical protein EAG_12470 [Camponotus floridanus]|uniref:Uncharacterized protein n=1 Tax=Camponotus floridanus TaxID=104421 RepID=E2B1B1_CAMFO|nr:hypothetical protein EAG_12470 [Camponotus floridanus]